MRKRLQRFNGKLSLKKETIANLGLNEMRRINGGAELVGIAIPAVKVTDGCITNSPCSTATMWETCINCDTLIGVNID